MKKCLLSSAKAGSLVGVGCANAETEGAAGVSGDENVSDGARVSGVCAAVTDFSFLSGVAGVLSTGSAAKELATVSTSTVAVADESCCCSGLAGPSMVLVDRM